MASPRPISERANGGQSLRTVPEVGLRHPHANAGERGVEERELKRM